MNEPVFLWRMESVVPQAARDDVAAVFERRAIAVTAFETEEDSGLWRIEGFCGAEPDRQALAREVSKACSKSASEPLSAPRCELVPPRNWLAENMMAFPPTRVGRYFVHGSGLAGGPPSGATVIKLDPGTAFGSGEHASTAGCLAKIEALAKERRIRRALDMGCGSGILAVAMAKTWRVPVVAADIDDEAARVAAYNARRNGVGPLVAAVCAPGYRSRQISASAPYDLIVANILARPLIAMAGDLARHLRQPADGGGVAILSGLLERDGRRVLAAHRARGLALRSWFVRDGWLTLGLEW